MNRQSNKRTDCNIYEQMDRWTDKQTSMDMQANEEADRQANR